MKKVKAKRAAIPEDSLVRNYLPAGYSDTYACEADFEKEPSPDDIMTAFWTGGPAWIGALFRLRNFLVKFVGLKGSGSVASVAEIASVVAKSGNETVMLLTDKHLDAYISVHIASRGTHGTISAITLVHFKNTLGRVYFFVIRPFHGIVAKNMLERAVRKSVRHNG